MEGRGAAITGGAADRTCGYGLANMGLQQEPAKAGFTKMKEGDVFMDRRKFFSVTGAGAAAAAAGSIAGGPVSAQPNMPGGLQTGFYRIHVSKKVNGQETIPAHYNTETTLGHQIAIDDEGLAKSGKIVLNLTTK